MRQVHYVFELFQSSEIVGRRTQLFGFALSPFSWDILERRGVERNTRGGRFFKQPLDAFNIQVLLFERLPNLAVECKLRHEMENPRLWNSHVRQEVHQWYVLFIDPPVGGLDFLQRRFK